MSLLPKKKPTWVEKLNDSKGFPKVKQITDKMSKHWGTGTVVIPAPIEVDEMMQKVPAEKLITINEIRAALAKKHKATIGCPMTRARRRKKPYALRAHPENGWDIERKIS